MIRSNGHRNSVIYFSRWSRKGYAVFAVLGKEVAVTTFSISICEKALLKSAKKGVVVRETEDTKACVLRNETMQQTVKTGFRVQAGEVCADANGENDKNECTTIKRYAAGRHTSFLC